MNIKLAAVTPAPIATVRSTKTVRPKVSNRIQRSPPGMRIRATNRPASLIPQATASRIAASAAIGTWAINPPPASAKTSRKRAWNTPESGDRAPDRMLVAVRAIAPVAGSPPNSAEARLATPWPTSSWFDRCLYPVIPSATTQERSASMPARNAIVKAAGNTSSSFASDKPGSDGAGSPVSIRGKREPIVSTCNPAAATAAEAATMTIR